MSLLDIDALPQVAVGFMNEDHREEARLLNAVTAALTSLLDGKGGRPEVTRAWRALEQHTRAHFAREERAMAQTRFPPFEVHRAEHELVLAAMEAELKAFEEDGEAERLARYVESAMPDWLRRHIETMDYVTARFLAAHGV
jgi:hemerythrin